MKPDLVLQKRNRSLLDLIAQGSTLKYAGDKYGISRQRVDQIIKRLGHSTRDFKKKRRFVFYVSTCNICRKEFLSRKQGRYFCSSRCTKIAFSRPFPKEKYITTTRKGKSITRHRLAMEEFLGRKLKKGGLCIMLMETGQIIK